MQPGVDRDVIVRIAPAHRANDPAFIRSFDADAQRLVRIEHPNVVAPYDFWREPDGAYVVRRYLRGGTLADLLDHGALEPAQAHRIAAQLTGAVTAAHRQSIAHGHLTTSNVVLDDDGNAYLADFVIGETAAPGSDSLPSGEGATASVGVTADVRALTATLAGVVADVAGPVHDIAMHAVARAPTDDGEAATLLSELASAVGTAVADGGTLADRGPAGSPPPARNPFKGLRAFTGVPQLWGRARHGIGGLTCGNAEIARTRVCA